jgi:hypothetical protein
MLRLFGVNVKSPSGEVLQAEEMWDIFSMYRAKYFKIW